MQMDRRSLGRRVAHREYGEVEEMLEKDSSCVDETENSPYGNKTPLEQAIIRLNVRMVRIMLSYGANPNMLTEAGDTPLSLVVLSACYGENPYLKEPAIATALLLIRYGADIEMPDADNQETPLMTSVMGEFFELTKILLYHGANVNTRDISGRTALMWAAFCGSVSEVALLVQHGADISIQGLDGLNAEQLAFEKADKGERFGEISENLRDIRELREARRLNIEKFDAFETINGDEGHPSLVHLINTDIIQNIREYA